MLVADMSLSLSIPQPGLLESSIQRVECSENMQRLAWAIQL